MWLVRYSVASFTHFNCLHLGFYNFSRDRIFDLRLKTFVKYGFQLYKNGVVLELNKLKHSERLFTFFSYPELQYILRVASI